MADCDHEEIERAIEACRHVREAIEASTPLAVAIVIDGWNDWGLECEACIAKNRARIDTLRRAASKAAVVVVVDADSPEPICFGCAERWYASLGRGELSEAVEELRSAQTRVDRRSG